MEYTKISPEQLVGHRVSELPDTPTITTSALKQKFDELSTDVIIPAINNLVDELNAAAPTDVVKSYDITDIKLDGEGKINVSTDDGATYVVPGTNGHTVVNGSNVAMPAENKLQFSDNVVITDVPSTKTTFISIPSGQKGDRGEGATIHIGTVEAVETDEVYVSNVGSDADAILNFGVPKGNNGDAATIRVGTVTSGATASVSNRGTTSDAVFDFVLPKGDKGDPGRGFEVLGLYSTIDDLETAHPTGTRGDAYAVGDADDNTIYIWNVDNVCWENIGKIQGAKGDTGDSATVTVGTVEAVAQGSEYVENVGTSTDAVLNFGLPKGDKGDAGDAATVAVGTVTSGTNASVTNVGTASNAVFNFVVPKGDKGDQGDPTIVNGKTGSSITLGSADIAYADGYTIGQMIKRTDDSIAPAWNEEASYGVGDYVSYYGKIFSANTTVPVGTIPSGTSPFWRLVTITSELGAKEWVGTQAQFESSKASIADGTIINITDDNSETTDTYDDHLDDTSINAVQNRVVKSAIDELSNKLTWTRITGLKTLALPTNFNEFTLDVKYRNNDEFRINVGLFVKNNLGSTALKFVSCGYRDSDLVNVNVSISNTSISVNSLKIGGGEYNNDAEVIVNYR